MGKSLPALVAETLESQIKGRNVLTRLMKQFEDSDVLTPDWFTNYLCFLLAGLPPSAEMECDTARPSVVTP
jgi:hypothetical protein